MILRSKDFLRFDEASPGEVDSLIGLAKRLKSSTTRKMLLKDKTLAMIFQKPSTRTRVSLEVGMYQMGGSSIVLSTNDMQLSRGETMADTARTLSLYVDFIMARVFEHEVVEELAAHSTVPVINGLSDSFHPCQTLADIMTIQEQKGSLSELKVAWIGDGNNVCNSLILGCAVTGMSIAVATPEEFRPDSDVVESASQRTDVCIATSPTKAVEGADVVMTDTFSSIHNMDPTKVAKFLPEFQVCPKLMAMAKRDAIFMHCLPAKRGQEVAASVIDGPQSVVWSEAENRLHSQKALLASLAGSAP